MWNILNLFAPRYPNGNLKKLLEEKFEGKTLGQVPAGPVFLFPTLELNPNLPAEAMKAFKVVVYNNREHPDELLSDVALKTSAAIMNLPIYEGFVEGGNYANDPALVGFFYALKQQKAEEEEQRLIEDRKRQAAQYQSAAPVVSSNPVAYAAVACPIELCRGTVWLTKNHALVHRNLLLKFESLAYESR